MQPESFEKNSLGWQLQLLQQRIGEWIERIFAAGDRAGLDQTHWGIPDWLQKVLFWSIVIGLIGWASWQMWNLLRPYLAGYWQARGDRTRFSSLPVASEKPAAEWLKQMRLAQRQGNYREACRALYMAALHHLSETNLIRQELSRTDGEYLHLLQNQPLARPYQVLIQTHEQLCFSRAPISADRFDRCWQAYQAIQKATSQQVARRATEETQ
ncbi:MAG: DUF4129 domain-containing protein [Elainellaceae cyanobacterium]